MNQAIWFHDAYRAVQRGATGLVAMLVLLTGCGGGGGGDGGPVAPVNQAPAASAALVGEAVAGANAILSSAASSDADGTIAAKSWNYGDGASGSADNHVYAAPGNYTATLTVTDNLGASASTTVAVTVAKCSASGTAAAQLSPFPTACIQTTAGEMVVEVYPALSPVTVANFLKYVDDGFYSGTLIHRTIPGFVVQGGGFTTGLAPKTATYPAIALESNNTLKNWQYTLAMARTNAPNSATSQFFINVVDNPSLDYDAAKVGANGYAVFGQVISGTSVVDTMATVPTRTVSGLADVPVGEIIIRSATRMP